MKITDKHLQQVIKEEIRNLVREQKETGIKLIQLSTPWCPPCKTLKQKFEQHNAPTDKWIYINVDPRSMEDKDWDAVQKYAGPLQAAGYLVPKGDGSGNLKLEVGSIPVLLKVNFGNGQMEVIDHTTLLKGPDIQFVQFLESNGLLNPAMRDGIVSPEQQLRPAEAPAPAPAPAAAEPPGGKFSPSSDFLDP